MSLVSKLFSSVMEDCNCLILSLDNMLTGLQDNVFLLLLVVVFFASILLTDLLIYNPHTMINLDSILKSRDITLPKSVKAVFSKLWFFQ